MKGWPRKKTFRVQNSTIRPSGMELIDRVPIPGGTGELGLYRRGSDLLIRIMGGQDLMNTLTHGSEDALGEITCTGLGQRSLARVLVGGLGMGFTLSAALGQLGSDAEVIVAELVPGVVAWNRGPIGSYADHPLRDPRVTVQEVDVAIVIKAASTGFDAILLVDNGPEGLTREDNQWLYSRAGLASSFQALRPGGVLGVWSAGADRAFSKRLHKIGFVVTEVAVRAHRGKGARHLIWLARKP